MIKTIVTFGILLITTSCIYSQDEINRFEIGIKVNPNIAYRAIIFDNSFTKQDKSELRDLYQDRDHSEFRFSIGVPVIIPVANKISLESGIYFSQRGTGNSSNGELFDTVTNAWEPVYVDGETILNYIDVPVQLRYDVAQKGSFTFYGKVGLAFNWLFLTLNEISIESNGETTFENSQTINQTDLYDYGYRLVNLSSIIAFGTMIRVHQNINLHLEPVFNFMVTPPFREEGHRKAHYYEMGLRTGITYSF